VDFSAFVTDLANGQVNQRLSEQLSKLVEGVEDTHQKGTLTVTFTVSEEGRQIKVDAKCEAKMPQHPLHGTLFFPVPDKPGEITRDDIRQLKLRNLAERASRKAVGDVDPNTGEVH
jgi:hypothetical protein